MNDSQTSVRGRVTAISAGILAALGSVVHWTAAAVLLRIAAIPPTVDCAVAPCPQPAYLPYLAGMGGSGLALLGIGVLLAVGSFGLFRRKPKARTQVRMACALVIVTHLAVVMVIAFLIEKGEITDTDAGQFAVAAVVAQVFPFAALVLASVPATARYLAYPADA